MHDYNYIASLHCVVIIIIVKHQQFSLHLLLIHSLHSV